MKAILFAYHEIGCQAIRTLTGLGVEIAAVFTHEDDARENVWFGSVGRLAQSLGIPTYFPEDVNRPEWVQKIRDLKPDLLFSFYYRRMISDAILSIPLQGGLNLHGSYLPKYRGRCPVNWAIIHGETETGMTLHYMVKKPDAGDIVLQKKIPITLEDTAATLYDKFIPVTDQILREAVPLLISGNAPRVPQDPAQATYFGGRKPADGKIDWTKSAREIYNLVRAVTHPYPGATAQYKNQTVWIWQSRFLERSPEGRTAEPAAWISLNPIQVQCGQGVLEVQRIQGEGEEEMSGSEWAQKRNLSLPECFTQEDF